MRRGPPWAASALLVALAAAARAEGPAAQIVGTVRDPAGRPVVAATLTLEGAPVTADGEGAFRLPRPAAPGRLRVEHPGYEPRIIPVPAGEATLRLEVVLHPAYRLSEEVVVQAVRAGEAAPVSRTDLDASAVDRLRHGQQMPFLLQHVPSATHYSDTGLGTGYAYFSLRGIGQTRINMTLDGVPLNDPEESAVYFANFADLEGAVDSIQIQRGVGSSTVGSAAYGGSVNFASVTPTGEAALVGELAGGTFGTLRGSLAAHSPRLPGGVLAWGRATYQETAGFRERSGVRQHAGFAGLTRQDEHSFLKFFGFSGRERTELAFLAVEPDVLERDLRSNPLAAEEVDRFGQDFAQLQYTRLLGRRTSLSAQAYYNGAQGWFRLFDPSRAALQQFAIDGAFAGLVLGAHYQAGGLQATWGGHVSGFARDHFLDLVGGGRAYLNTGRKGEAMTFLKLARGLGRALLHADAQVRHAAFRYEGDLPLGRVAWTFLNPKAGVRFRTGPRLSLYASVGATTREPTRNDLFAGEDNPTLPYDLRAVRPERVTDFEAGLELLTGALRLRANAYAMEFRREIALTGQLSEIGLPLRRNVPRSHRRGLEAELAWSPRAGLDVTAAGNVSWNRLREWVQHYDVFGPDGSLVDRAERTFRSVQPLLTPRYVVNVGLRGRPARSLELGATARAVGRAFLDNTNGPGLVAPAWADVSASARLDLPLGTARGRPSLRVDARNLLDRRIYASGYSYLYLRRDEDGREAAQGVPYFYPLATRHFLATLSLRF
jgi:iron complex outermembrane receptor protein